MQLHNFPYMNSPWKTKQLQINIERAGKILYFKLINKK